MNSFERQITDMSNWLGAGSSNSAEKGWIMKGIEAATLGTFSAAASAVNQTVTGVANLVDLVAAPLGVTVSDSLLQDTTQNWLDWFDTSSQSALSDYYREHKQVLDTAGFVGASIMPGLAGVKIANAARSAVASRSVFGAQMSWLAPDYFVNAAVNAGKIARTENAAIYGGLFRNAATGSGAGTLGALALEGAVQGLAADAMITTLLWNTPIWDDLTASEKLKNYATDAVLFGAAGNLLFGGLAVGKKLASYTEELNAKRFDAAGISGKVDAKVDYAQAGLAPGTVIAGLASDLQRVKTSVDYAGLRPNEIPGVKAAQTASEQAIENSILKRLTGMMAQEPGVDAKQIYDELVKPIMANPGGKSTLSNLFTDLYKIERTTADALINTRYPGTVLLLKSGELLDRAPEWLSTVLTKTAKVSGNTIETGGGFKFGNLEELAGKFHPTGALSPEELSPIRLQATHYWVEDAIAKAGKLPDIVPESIPWMQAWLRHTSNDAVAKFNSTLTREQVQAKVAAMIDNMDSNMNPFMAMETKARTYGLMRDITPEFYSKLPEAETVFLRYRTPEMIAKDNLPQGVSLDARNSARSLPHGAIIAQAQAEAELRTVSDYGRLLVAKLLPDSVGQLLNKESLAGSLTAETLARFKGGAGLINPANVNYNPLDATVAYLSKTVSNIRQRMLDETSAQIAPSSAVLKGDKSAMIEVSYAASWARAQKGIPIQLRTDDGRLALVNQDFGAKILESGGDLRATVADLARQNTQSAKRLEDAVLLIDSPNASQYLENYARSEVSLSGKHRKITDYNKDRPLPGQSILSKAGFDEFYIPAIDPVRENFVALVRRAEGSTLNDGKTFLITARNADDLARMKADHVAQGYQVIDKTDSKIFFQSVKDYQEELAINSRTIHETEQRLGTRVGDLSLVKPEQIIQDLETHLATKTSALARRAVYTANRDFFDSLELSARKIRDLNQSQQTLAEAALKGTTNPALDAYMQALDISPQKGGINGFLNQAGFMANEAIAKLRAEFPWNKVNSENLDDMLQRMKQLGMSSAFGTAIENPAFRESLARSLNTPVTGAGFDTLIRTSNALVTRTQLLYDAFHSAMVLLSKPIMEVAEFRALRRAAAQTGALTPEFEAAMNAQGLLKSEYQAVKYLFKKVGDADLPKEVQDLLGKSGYSNSGASFQRMFEDLGIINPAGNPYAQEVQGLVVDALKTKGGISEANTILNKAKLLMEKADKLGGATESYVQYSAAMRMFQLASKANLSWDDTRILMNAYVQRTQGLYTSSQRPELFRSSVGSAIGLFQSYQLRLMQRLGEHIQAGDGKAIAMMAGLQASMFGTKTLPMFDYLNRALVSDHNKEKNDIYTGAYDLLGAEGASSLMYGVAGSLLSSAAFQRADTTPRNPTLIPLNPAEIPTISIGTRLAGATIDAVKAMNLGGEVTPAMLHWLEHQGLSRPLGGAAAVLRGHSTTRQGEFLSDEGGTLFSLAGLARIAGSRPYNEGIMQDQLAKVKAYEAADRAKRLDIAQSIRVAYGLGEDSAIPAEQFDHWAEAYLRAGGTNTGLRQFYVDNLRKATEPQLDRYRERLARGNQDRLSYLMELGQ